MGYVDGNGDNGGGREWSNGSAARIVGLIGGWWCIVGRGGLLWACWGEDTDVDDGAEAGAELE